MAGGLKDISDALKAQRGQLLWILPTLAAAETKWQGISDVIKGIVIWKMVGPLTLVSAAFTGISTTVRTLLRDTGSLEAVFRRLAAVRGLEGQFKAMGVSAEAARQKVVALVRLTEDLKLFRLEDVGESAKALEILTRGAFSGADALRMMADSAQASGNSLADTSGAVGEFYADLAEGRPIATASNRLRSMGIISAEAAARLGVLGQSGAATETIVATLGAELAKAAGAVDLQKKSIEGLNRAHDAAREALKQKFGAPFTEAENDSIEHATALLIALGPTVEKVSNYVAMLIGPVERLTSRVAGWALSLQGMPKALAAVGTGIVSLIAGLTVLGTAFGLKALYLFVSGLVSVSRATGAAAAAQTNFAAAATAARGAGAALAQGNVVLAGTQTLVAARAAIAGSAIRLFSFAMAAIPWIAAFTAVSMLINRFMDWRAASAAADKSVQETADSTRDLVAGLREQESAMASLEDKVRTLTSANEALTAAQREYYEALNTPVDGDSLDAQNRIIEAKRQKVAAAAGMVASITARNAFGPTTAERNHDAQREERAKRQKEMEFDRRLQAATPEQAMRMRSDKIAELRRLESTGRAGLEGRAATDRARLEGNPAVQAAKARLEELEAWKKGLLGNSVYAPHYDEAARERLAATVRKQGMEPYNQARADQEALGLKSTSKSVVLETQANMMQAGFDAKTARARLGNMARGGDADPARLEEQKAEIDRLQRLSGGRVGTPDQINRARALAAKARAIEDAANENGDRAGELSAAQRSAQIEYDTAARKLAVETKIAALKSVGVTRATEEWAIRRKGLEDEAALLDARGGDANTRAAINAQISEGDRAESEAQAQFAAAARQLAIEEQIAALKSEGYERARDEWAIRRKGIEDELRIGAERGEDANTQGTRAGAKREGDRSAMLAQRQNEAATRGLGIERAIANLKNVGVDRASQEWAIRRKGLMDEARISAAQGGSANDRAGYINSILEGDRSERESRRSATVSALGVRGELRQGQLSRAGDAAGATTQADLASFAQTFEQMRGIFGDAKGASMAQQLTQNSIAQSVFDADKSGVVDSLQRIGGGGVSADPMLSVAERQAKFQESMVGYLRILAAAAATAPAGTTQAPYTFGDTGE